MTNETDTIAQLKKNTVISTLSLFFQGGYSAILGLAANLVLTILLSPAIFGIYFTVLSIISILNYFSDIGLAGSLIQKKDISDEDIKTTFTIQQILIIIVISVGFFLTPFIQKFYQLPHEGILLYWALLASFFISSLKTIPSILLERKVEFKKIVLVQITENTFFYLTVIVLSLLRFNLLSFAYAVILRALVGLILIYSISFWRPRIGISQKSMKQLLSFGLPFQASSFLALFKDDLIILYLGKVLGFEALGYIGWAKKWAEAPIRIIMDNVSRVLFPVIARLQSDKIKVQVLIEKILDYQTKLLAPIMVGMAITMSSFVALIPKYSKWEPALPFFYLFCISAFFASYSSPFINLFNALGKAKIPFLLMLFWTSANWILTVYLTKLTGYYGFPLTQVILAFTFVMVVREAKKIVSFHFIKPIFPSIISALIMGGFVLTIIKYGGPSFISLPTAIIVGVIIYFSIQRIVFRTNIFFEVKNLFLHD